MRWARWQFLIQVFPLAHEKGAGKLDADSLEVARQPIPTGSVVLLEWCVVTWGSVADRTGSLLTRAFVITSRRKQLFSFCICSCVFSAIVLSYRAVLLHGRLPLSVCVGRRGAGGLRLRGSHFTKRLL